MADAHDPDDVETPWGPVGLVTFERTYARAIDPADPSRGVETFRQALERVIRACKTQLHCGFTAAEERELLCLLLGLKGSVAGRFLWQLGTGTVEKYGLLSLQNCAAMRVDDPIECFVWLFDCLMLGVGVGSNIELDTVRELPAIHYAHITHADAADADFIVPDSREGWCSLLRQVLSCHFAPGHARKLCYSTQLVRKRGSPIRTFGGVASGPEPLMEGVTKINQLLNRHANERPAPVVLLDVANFTAQIVVSGGVRRSAMIAIGTAEDDEYVEAKRWDLGSIPYERANCNNSVSVTRISALPDAFWEGYAGNGEPYGLVNIELARQHGQIGGGTPKTDPRVVSVNPCVVGDTMITLGDGAVRMADLLDQPTLADCGAAVQGSLCAVKSAWLSKPSALVVEVQTTEGFSLRCTPDHRVYVNYAGGEYRWVKAQQLGGISAEETAPELVGFASDQAATAESAHDGTRPARAVNLTLPAIVLNQGYLARRTWSGVRRLGDDLAQHEAALGYALGALIGDGTIDADGKASFVYYGDEDMPDHVDCMAKVAEAVRVANGSDAAPAWRFSAGTRRHVMCSSRFGHRVAQLLDVRQGHKRVTAALESMSSTFLEHLVAGLFDTDGSITSRSARPSIRFTQSSLETMQRLQRILLRFGIMSTFRKQGPQVARVGDWVGANNVPRYDLSVQTVHFARFHERIPLLQRRRAAELALLAKSHSADHYEPDNPVYFRASVTRVVPLPRPEPVYDLEVSHAHAFSAGGMLVHNCSEQFLEDRETCCLAEVFLPNCTTRRQLTRTVEFLYRICKHSLRLPCHWPSTEAVVHKNMRMGIGISGYMQADEEQRRWLPAVARWLDGYDEAYSKARGWPASIKLRTVKPSGTLSLLAGVTAGCHPAYAQYCLKRMRMRASHPLVEEARRRGYHVEPVECLLDRADPADRAEDAVAYDMNTMVVDFPIAYPPGTALAAETSAVRQMEVVRRLQRDWSDNAVSVTVTYTPDELPAIRRYLERHWRSGMKAVSFLRHSDHGFRQAPWTPITKEEYERRMRRITVPFGAAGDDSAGAGAEDETVDAEAACAGGACPVR